MNESKGRVCLACFTCGYAYLVAPPIDQRTECTVQQDGPDLPVIWLIKAQLTRRHVNWKEPPDS